MSTSARATCTSTTGLRTRRSSNKLIYHFGTGTHHVVGKEQAKNGSGNMVFGITASIEEYDAYIKLVAENSRVAKNYVAYFGDIYLTNPKLLPDFDVVTMVHLCEFFYPEHHQQGIWRHRRPRRARSVHGEDEARRPHPVLHKVDRLREGEADRREWEKEAPVTRVGEFKTLAVYRKN